MCCRHSAPIAPYIHPLLSVSVQPSFSPRSAFVPPPVQHQKQPVRPSSASEPAFLSESEFVSESTSASVSTSIKSSRLSSRLSSLGYNSDNSEVYMKKNINPKIKN